VISHHPVLLIFCHSLLLCLSNHQISALYVPSLNLKPNPCGGAAKKIKSSPYKKFVEATQKKKIKQATKSTTNQLESNALLGSSKRQKSRVCQDATPTDTPSDLDTDLAVLFADDST
jgi:hypothetical protein